MAAKRAILVPETALDSQMVPASAILASQGSETSAQGAHRWPCGAPQPTDASTSVVKMPLTQLKPTPASATLALDCLKVLVMYVLPSTSSQAVTA